MIPALRALVLAIWTLAGVRMTGDTEAIAEAIAQAVDADGEGPPVYGSHAEDAAVLAVYVMAESNVQLHPRPMSWDAKAGISVGAFQAPAFIVRSHSLAYQAAFVLSLMHRGTVVCPAQPLAPVIGGCRAGRKQGDWRVAKARELLRSLL